MNESINILAILKGKPQGTKLHDSVRGIDVYFDKVDNCNKVHCTFEEKELQMFTYSSKGTLVGFEDGMVVLLPSEEMQDWRKFAWNKGDVLVCTDGKAEVIFERFDDDNYTSFVGKHYLESYGEDGDLLDYEQELFCDTANYTKESDETIQCYINTIEERLGGKLNRETLEIEPAQSEFKDGDIVCISGMGYLAYGIVKSIDYLSKKLEYYVLNDMSFLKINDWLSFEDKQIQPITETQQIILFEALAKEDKAWDSEKKQIVDLKPKCEFKPFQKVLTRDRDTQYWEAELFGFKDGNGLYHCVGGSWKCCVPYEGNESLLGTTKDVED